MPRHTDDSAHVYRAVVKYTYGARPTDIEAWKGQDPWYVSMYGPYTSLGTARARITREKTLARQENQRFRRSPGDPGFRIVEGYPEVATTTWSRVEGDDWTRPEPKTTRRRPSVRGR